MGKSIDQKMDELRNKFNLAESVVEEMDDNLDSLEIAEVGDPGQHLPTEVLPDQVFSLELLKGDFALVRSNVVTLINRGQNILEGASALDIGDLKAGQLEALASLQKSLGDNIKLLMGIYKDIVSIEKDKATIAAGIIDPTRANGQPGIPGMNVKGNVHQQIIVTGSPSDLLKRAKEDAPIEVACEKHLKEEDRTDDYES